MAYGYLNKYDATTNTWKEHGADATYVRKYYEGVHYRPGMGVSATTHYDGYSAFGTEMEFKTGDNQFKYITFCMPIMYTEYDSEQYIIIRGNWQNLAFPPYQITFRSGMAKSPSETFTATLSYVMEYDPQRNETYIKITDWHSQQLNGLYIYFGVYNPNWTVSDVYGLLSAIGRPTAAEKINNSEWLSYMRYSYSAGDYYWFSHKRGNEVEVLTTTQNIGVNVELKRAGTGYGTYYTQISSNTPMRFIEQSISEPRTITITHPSSTALRFFTADTTGDINNFSNFADASVSTAVDGNNTVYTILLPANKRLLICYQYSYTPTGQYTYKADYYGITPDKATVGTISWL